MTKKTGKKWLAAAALSSTLLAMPAVVTLLMKTKCKQSYRQSYFALLAANFGPWSRRLKARFPGSSRKWKNWANDLAALSTLNIMRGFGDGSDKGTTRAKPEIWENKADFTS